MAKKYREHVKSVVSKNLAAAAVVSEDNSVIYKLDFTFFMHELEQQKYFEFKTRGKAAGERRAKLRYKRVDTDNRLKFLQDWLCKCLGMEDDSLVFSVSGEKVSLARDDPRSEYVKVIVAQADRSRHLGELEKRTE